MLSEEALNADRVIVDPRYPARLDASVPQNDADMAVLQRYLGMDSAAEVVERMLGPTIDDLPPPVKPLYKVLVKRAAVVMRCKKPVAEQLFRDLTPQNVDILAPKLRDIYRHCAGILSNVVNDRLATFKAQAEFPDRLRLVLDEAAIKDQGLVRGLQFVIENGFAESRIRIVGATERDVSSVFCSTKATGLGAQRVGEDLIVCCRTRLCLSDELVFFVERVRGALGAVAQIRATDDGALLARYEVGDRARALHLLEYVETNALRGYAYAKYIDRLRELHVERFPDLNARLDHAIDLSAKPEDARNAERWVSYVESASIKGYVYKKGAKAVQEMDLTSMPELQVRFESAMTAPTRAQALRWLEYVETAAAKGYIYGRGVDKLKQLDLASTPLADIGARLNTVLADKTLRSAYEVSTGRSVAPISALPELCAVWQAPAAPGSEGEGEGEGEGRLVFVLRLGAEYPITAKNVEMYGSHLADHLGEPGCRVYWREATEAEIVAFEQSKGPPGDGDTSGSIDASVERQRG